MGNQGDLTTPGELLGVIEEFTPGEGCYEHQGQVRAAVVGKVFYDMINRKSNIIPERKSLSFKLRKAKYVYGVVSSLKEDYAIVEVSGVEERFINPSITGYLHISQVAQKHVKDLRDAIRPSDVIKAKPISFTYPLQLTLRGRDLGVIIAYCSVCGTLMIKADEEHLKCPNCNNVEPRRIGPYTVRGNGSRS
ncbi:MAG: exosome complex RNA-binding protein Csl4 [Metallosphaera sp.]|uniref:exosome complex RNA-binding protein Csl4 n=1 Tax=Metallosphaera sp. TaxID=2020860 RepID=UPI0031642C92